MFLLLQRIIIVIILSYISTIFADNTTNPKATTQKTNATAITPPKAILPNMTFKKDVCPHPASLVKGDDLWWTAPVDWKSDSESFVNKIDHFLGARWTGINVGKIVCLYTGSGKATFPIALIRETLVPKPSGANWGPDLGGYKDCRAHDVNDCPFFIEKPKKVKDIYQELDFYKGQKDS